MSASFDYYRTFYYVAKYKNFTRAATMLLSSQPSVTRSIQNLESELGCRLFIRSRHGVTLTPEGEMLYRYVAPACERILRGEEELGLSLGLHGGAVSVGATETALHCLLLDRLALFQKEHPDVKIRISNGTTAHMLSDLKEGRTDVAVVPTPLQIEKPYSTVRLRPVRSILVGGPRFSALMDKPISLQELQIPAISAFASISPDILVSQPTIIVGLCLFSRVRTYAPACPSCIAKSGVSSSFATPLTPSVPNILDMISSSCYKAAKPSGFRVFVCSPDSTHKFCIPCSGRCLHFLLPGFY